MIVSIGSQAQACLCLAEYGKQAAAIVQLMPTVSVMQVTEFAEL